MHMIQGLGLGVRIALGQGLNRGVSHLWVFRDVVLHRLVVLVNQYDSLKNEEKRITVST